MQISATRSRRRPHAQRSAEHSHSGASQKIWLRGSGSNRRGLAAPGNEPGELPTTLYLASKQNRGPILAGFGEHPSTVLSPWIPLSAAQPVSGATTQHLFRVWADVIHRLAARCSRLPLQMRYHTSTTQRRTVWDSNPSDRLERPGISTRNRTVHVFHGRLVDASRRRRPLLTRPVLARYRGFEPTGFPLDRRALWPLS